MRVLVIDTLAPEGVLAALETGHVAGAAIDVGREEAVDADFARLIRIEP